MCLFSRTVREVSATSIFARGTAGGRQLLVYSMTLAADDDVAMVLPLPVPARSPEDAVRFIDLSGYPDFFAHLRAGFPVGRSMRLQTQSFGLSAKTLEVHQVGAFEASFVPTLADFDRVDERFRLPPGIWDALPDYRDDGFAVFKLQAGRKEIHPMAFELPRREPRLLFFPTVHIHDGTVHASAEFDHTLYCQTAYDHAAWQRTPEPASAFMRGDSRGIIDPSAGCLRHQMIGKLPNRDTWYPDS